MITGTAGMWTAEERLAGFVETMEAAGVAADLSLCVAGNYRGDAAYEATKPLMTRVDRPTAMEGRPHAVQTGGGSAAHRRTTLIEANTNALFRDSIVTEATSLLTDRERYERMARAVNPYGDGKASERIADTLESRFGNARR